MDGIPDATIVFMIQLIYEHDKKKEDNLQYKMYKLIRYSDDESICVKCILYSVLKIGLGGRLGGA